MQPDDRDRFLFAVLGGVTSGLSAFICSQAALIGASSDHGLWFYAVFVSVVYAVGVGVLSTAVAAAIWYVGVWRISGRRRVLVIGGMQAITVAAGTALALTMMGLPPIGWYWMVPIAPGVVGGIVSALVIARSSGIHRPTMETS